MAKQPDRRKIKSHPKRKEEVACVTVGWQYGILYIRYQRLKTKETNMVKYAHKT